MLLLQIYKQINVLDKSFAESLNIGINKTTESACAANRIPLDVFGQTSCPVSVQCPTDTGPVMIHLGIMLVVANLGVPCLMGEPAKRRNNIICLPRHKMIIIANGDSIKYVP